MQLTHRELGLPLNGSYPDVLIVADDVFGGLFALDGGRFESNSRGQVFHLAADSVVWVPLNLGYTDFVSWCLTGNVDLLYEHLRDFEMEPRPAFDAVYSFYPFLWTKESRVRRPDARAIDATGNVLLRVELLGFATGES